MDESTIEYWMPEEHRAGLCTESEVGKIKPPLIEARRLAQRATPKAVKALVDAVEQNDDLQAKVKAAQVLLERGWGKPDQQVTTNVIPLDNMPWVSAQRLAYRMPAAPQQIEDATAKPGEPKPVAAPHGGTPLVPPKYSKGEPP